MHPIVDDALLLALHGDGPAVLLFIVLPIAEIYVIIQVGEAIGVVPTIALLILDGFLGAALLRSQGRAAWERFNGRSPTVAFPPTRSSTAR